MHWHPRVVSHHSLSYAHSSEQRGFYNVGVFLAGFLVDDAMFIEAVVKPSSGSSADSALSRHVQSMEM